MGKKNKKADSPKESQYDRKNELKKAIRENNPDGIIKGLDKVREFAIPNKDDVYLSILSDAKGRNGETNSEAWVLMNGLYDKVYNFLKKLQEGEKGDTRERQELVDAIAEANRNLVEKLMASQEKIDDKSRFYIQRYIIDLTFALAEKADHVFDLLGMYYYLLRMWNDERSGSEDFRKLFGDDYLSDFIRVSYKDIEICQNSNKFDGIKWLSYLENNAQKNDKSHIQVFSKAVLRYKQEVEEGKGTAGKGSVSSERSPHNRGIVQGPAGKGGEKKTDSVRDDYEEVTDLDKKVRKEVTAQGSHKNSKGEKEKPQKESGWRTIVLVLIVIVSMILGGIVGYILGASKGQSHSSNPNEFTETSETADQGNTEISAEGVTTGEGVEYQQKEDKSDPAGKESNKQDTEPEAVDQKDGNAAEPGSSEQGGEANAESGTSGQGEEENEEQGSSEQDGQENKKSGSEDQAKQSENEDNQDVDAVEKGKEGVEYKLEEKQELRLERRKVIFKHDIF